MFSLKILLNIELFGIWKAIIIPPLENLLFNLFKLKLHRKNKTFDSLSAGSRVRYYTRGVSTPILISTVTSWLTLVDNLQFISVIQSCLTLCDHMDCSTPGLPVHHQLLEFTQTHVHWVSDAIQPSHPLLPPSPLAFNLSQQKSLFKWVSPSHQVAKVLEFQLQHQSFQWIFRTDFI